MQGHHYGEHLHVHVHLVHLQLTKISVQDIFQFLEVHLSLYEDKT